MSDNLRFGFILEYVPDIDEARRFFTSVMGLQIAREHPTFIQFSDNAGMSYAVSTDEPLGGTGAPEVYWVVDDVEESFARLSQAADVSMPLRKMPFGMVFAINDPNGQSHYFVQFARERPSRAME